MRMSDMENALKREGFDVEISYDRTRQMYKFVISRGTDSLEDFYKYPNDRRPSEIDNDQRMFIERIVSGYRNHFGTRRSNNLDADDALTYSYTAYSNCYGKPKNSFEIKDVIFNDLATIVFWSDGTKTVVKCQPGDMFNPETGLAMAIAKKALGNKGNYCNVFHKWLDKDGN